MKLVQIILEVIGWLQITLGVTLVASLIAFIIYLKWDNRGGKTATIIFIFLGFIIGAIWATCIWKKHGTIAWLSRIRKIS